MGKAEVAFTRVFWPVLKMQLPVPSGQDESTDLHVTGYAFLYRGEAQHEDKSQC